MRSADEDYGDEYRVLPVVEREGVGPVQWPPVRESGLTVGALMRACRDEDDELACELLESLTVGELAGALSYAVRVAASTLTRLQPGGLDAWLSAWRLGDVGES